MVAGARHTWMNGHSDTRNGSKHRDLEAGSRRGAVRARFRDIVGSVIEDERRMKMKKALLNGIDRYNFEHFRKSDEEVPRFPFLWTSPPC